LSKKEIPTISHGMTKTFDIERQFLGEEKSWKRFGRSSMSAEA
jgi:hypothetical protein